MDELTWMPAWKIRELIAAREVSCTEVTEHFLARIEKFNPTLHAFAEVDTDGALVRAAMADAAVTAGDELGPLHGIPTAVKSHIRVEGLLHTQFAQSVVSPFDDVSVERLRGAGAVIVGTNTMMGAGATAPSDRDNPGVFRPFNWDAEARSPWDTDRVPGWSSSAARRRPPPACCRSPSAPTAAARRASPAPTRAWSGCTRLVVWSRTSTTRSRP